MAELLEKRIEINMTVSDVKCRTESSLVDDSAPNGESEKSGGSDTKNVKGDEERNERKRKTRRRKTKRKIKIKVKNPSQRMEDKKSELVVKRMKHKGYKERKQRMRNKAYEQPVAPYNSNQFLIDDHNDLQDFDMKLMEAAKPDVPARTGRVRDPSFTSADSDDDYFYSSPEDEEEFLTKEFSNTYQDVHIEHLANMSKPDLIQSVIHLEEKVDKLSRNNPSAESTDSRIHSLQSEVARLLMTNQKLLSENARLRDAARKSSSTEDSESDSSSSSSSEDDANCKHMNGDIYKETDIKMEHNDNT